MPSERTLFQQSVAKSASREPHREAVRELRRIDAVDQLSTLTQTNGIAGPLWRAAVRELKELHATEALETISENTAFDPAIREQAQL